MTLREALLRLDSLNSEATIFVDRAEPVGLATPVVIAAISEDDEIPPEAVGKRELLDVWHARDTLEGLERLLNQQTGRRPTQDELLDRFIAYLKHDA